MADSVLLGLQVRELLPGEVVFQVTPDPLNRIQLWTVGRQPHAPHMLRPAKALGGVRAAVIQEQDVQAVGECLAEGVKKELKGICVQIRELQKETFASCGSHSPIDVEPLEDVLDQANRLDAACGQPSSAYGQQANAALVLAKHPHRAGVLGWNEILQLLLTGRLKLRYSVRVFFVWLGRGTLSLALNRVRTMVSSV